MREKNLVYTDAASDSPQSGQLHSEIAEGTKLFYVGNRRKEYWTVTKVGRKWISFGPYSRADKNTLEVDGRGYSQNGRLWRSEEEYEEERRLVDLWRRLLSQMERTRWAPPKDMTEFKIRQMAAIAGFSLDEVI